MLDARRTRIEQGLKDAEQARATARAPRRSAWPRCRRPVGKRTRSSSGPEGRPGGARADIAATKADLERMRERAAAEIESEKQRAIADLRNEVADLALRAAGKVVGES